MHGSGAAQPPVRQVSTWAFALASGPASPAPAAYPYAEYPSTVPPTIAVRWISNAAIVVPAGASKRHSASAGPECGVKGIRAESAPPTGQEFAMAVPWLSPGVSNADHPSVGAGLVSG